MRRSGWRTLWIVGAALLALGCERAARDETIATRSDTVSGASVSGASVSGASVSASGDSVATATGAPTAAPITAPSAAGAAEATGGFGTDVGFRSSSRLDEHFVKHGAEFGRITKAEYLRQAQRLRDAPVSSTVLEARRADGVISRFDRVRGTFIAFDRDGIIRTFFRPNDGEAYFRRQARRRPNP